MAKKKRPEDARSRKSAPPKAAEKDAPESTTEGEAKAAPETVEQAVSEAIAEEREDEKRAEIEQSPEIAGSGEAHPGGAAWAEPIARFERKWTWLEARLITVVLLAQILVLCAWVFLSGLASPVSADNAAGTVFRAVAGALVLGLATHVVVKRRGLEGKTSGILLRLAAIAIGCALAPAWRKVGVYYFDNVRSWLQGGSMLTLVGGLRGLGTRLTLWVALLGASLATAAGKHIHIDVVFRFLPKKARLYGGLVSFVATAAVCFAATWGFFDHIAIESYGAKADARPAEKVEIAMHELSEHAFLTRKQLGLDLRTFPRVLAGKRYDQWLTPDVWNAWLRDGSWEARFGKEKVEALVVPADAGTHPPLVIAPDGMNTRGMLVEDLDLVFPFGLLVIGIRFLIRALLVLSGHLELDPEAAHRSDEPEAATAKGGA